MDGLFILESTMSEVKKQQQPQPASTKVKVKNTSSRTINLANGCIQSGKTGDATLAELQAYSSVLEKATADKKV
jgi:hypothetical protein